MSRAISIATIRHRNTGHWFSPSTMRFFNTRLPRNGYEGPGGVYFVSSEAMDYNSPRLYSVRRQQADGDIDTVGKFHSYTSSAAATAEAKRLADGGGSERRRAAGRVHVHVPAYSRRPPR